MGGGGSGCGGTCLTNVFKRAWPMLMLLADLASNDCEIYGPMMVIKFMGQ